MSEVHKNDYTGQPVCHVSTERGVFPVDLPWVLLQESAESPAVASK